MYKSENVILNEVKNLIVRIEYRQYCNPRYDQNDNITIYTLSTDSIFIRDENTTLICI